MLTIRYLPVLLAALLANASPSVLVSYKLDDQLPPIARIHAPFTWTIPNSTFTSPANATLTYTASSLPAWLSFDPKTHTLQGTPGPDDEGSPRITVTAKDPASDDSASSAVTLCVTPYPPPELHIPVQQQFTDKNPSLSSVFLVPNNSALYNARPALRVPPKWSYSIGFQYNTFTAPNSLYYAATQADGSPLPDWVTFNEKAMTFGGVTPRPEELNGPHTVSLVLHASDQQGYSAATIPFDLVVAAHDMTLATLSLPTINVTADAPFQLTLNSAADFSGVLIDGLPLAPSNITDLDIDTSGLESWLQYNATSKTLSGQPPSDFVSGVLPVTLTSSVNQTLQTNVAIAAVPSFFSTPNLQPVLIDPGNAFSFDLVQYFSNSSGLGDENSGVNLTATYDPSEAGDYLNFDSSSGQLSGTVPSGIPYPHITVTFTAYSRLTHSTSHTNLPLSLSTSDYSHQHNKTGGLSTASRAKLVLGLKIAFGIISAFASIAIAFAILRRCTHVADTAVVGVEAQRAWTDAEMRWYGIGIEVDGEQYVGPKAENGYGWNEEGGPSSPGKEATGFGATLSRVLTRTLSNSPRVTDARSPLSLTSLPQSPGVMKKVEFLGKIRNTARIVSDKYRRVVSGPKRPVIGKPTLIMTSDNRASALANIDGLPTTNDSIPDLPHFEVSRYAPSGLTSLIDSPSSSTDARSVPRRRADFAAPRVIKTPPVAHAKDNRQSMKSVASSFATSSSTRTHEAEAVITHAARATSVRSAVSALSFQSGPTLEGGRPRLVQFTNAARVPVPKLPSSFFSPDPNEPLENGGSPAAPPKRVASQMAKVFRNVGGAGPKPPAESTDELKAGIEYVRALGDDGRSLASKVTVDEASPNPSFSSLESSQHGHDGAAVTPRMLARVGERFRYRVATTVPAGKAAQLEVRLVSGKPLPRYMRANVDAVPSGMGTRAERRVVELSGTPAGIDVAEIEVGVYVRESGECVGRVVVEVVDRKAG